MKALFSLIALGTLAFLALVSYQELQQRWTVQPATNQAPDPASQPTTPPVPATLSSTAESSAVEVAVESPAPREPRHRIAPPGNFSLVQRVTVTNEAGVLAILPGEEVKLLYRNKNGTARVKWGNHELLVPEAQLAKEIILTTKRSIVSPPATSPAPLLGQRGN